MYNIMAPLLYYGAVHVYGEGSVNMDILLAEQKWHMGPYKRGQFKMEVADNHLLTSIVQLLV